MSYKQAPYAQDSINSKQRLKQIFIFPSFETTRTAMPIDDRKNQEDPPLRVQHLLIARQQSAQAFQSQHNPRQ